MIFDRGRCVCTVSFLEASIFKNLDFRAVLVAFVPLL
jgi:hypothetical protein